MKNVLFRYFLAGSFKNNSHISSQHAEICQIPKFHENFHIFHQFVTKNAIFGYFWARILKSYCHISSQHTQICLTAKCSSKTRRPIFMTKSALSGYLKLL